MNILYFSERSAFREEWTAIGGDIGTNNQYIFAEEMIEGEKLYFIILPFNMPFRVADSMVVFTTPYCFVSPPDNIEDSLENINRSKGVTIVSSIEECGESSKKVCFESESECDVIVRGTCVSSQCETRFDGGIVFVISIDS